jgi:hypothetical protein
MGFDLKQHKATIWDDGNLKFSATTVENTGKAVLGVLKNAEASKNQYIYV